MNDEERGLLDELKSKSGRETLCHIFLMTLLSAAMIGGVTLLTYWWATNK